MQDLKDLVDDDADATDTHKVASAELRQFIERIERLETEKKDIVEQIKEVFAESKGRGYDQKAMRTILAQRKKDRDALAEEEAVLQMYKEALGMT